MNEISDDVGMAPETMDMGGAPPHTDTDSTSRLWAGPKPDSLKARRQCAKLSLPVLTTRSPTRARTTRTVRWTLALRPAETNYLGESKTL